MIGALLVLNDVDKIFLLTPHTGILIIIVPVFSYWTYYVIKEKGWFETPKVFYLSIILGFLLLSYPAFVVAIPSIIIAQILRTGFKEIKNKLYPLISRSIIITIITAMPSIAWIQFLIFRNGSFNPVETTRYGQIVWMKTAFQEGRLAQQLSIVAGDMIRLASPYHIIVLLYLVFVSWILLGNNFKLIGSANSLRKIIDGLIISLLFFVFFCITGRIKNRLAFSVIPPLIISVAQVVDDFSKKSTNK